MVDRVVGRVDVRAAARRAEGPSAPAPSPGCLVCGGALVRLGFVPAALPAVFDTS